MYSLLHINTDQAETLNLSVGFISFGSKHILSYSNTKSWRLLLAFEKLIIMHRLLQALSCFG